ncbi:MAG: hypothetical protein AAF353_21020 [Pseudomonadota bacterium]
MNRFARGFAICLLLLMAVGCSSFPRYPVDAQLLNEPIETTVDSAEAQYYLNHYLQDERINPKLDREIDLVYQNYPAKLPDRDDLKEISYQFSNDFAALFLADRLWEDQKNRQVQQAFQQKLALSREDLFNPPDSVENYLVLLVPGWNYVANGHITGSDFAAPRRLLDEIGIENHLVLVPSNGSVLQSAELIATSIQRHSGSGKEIVIVGASAAGPSIHLTLGEILEHDQLESVVAWINLGGILQGSPLVDYFQEWPQALALNLALAWLDWDKEEILSMSAKNSRERTKSLELPEDLLIINYLGLSLTGSLSSLSASKYPLISDQGPNDGLTPLADIIAPDSMTLVATQSDHYFAEDPEIDVKTIAIVKTVLELLESDVP